MQACNDDNMLDQQIDINLSNIGGRPSANESYASMNITMLNSLNNRSTVRRDSKLSPNSRADGLSTV